MNHLAWGQYSLHYNDESMSLYLNESRISVEEAIVHVDSTTKNYFTTVSLKRARRHINRLNDPDKLKATNSILGGAGLVLWGFGLYDLNRFSAGLREFGLMDMDESQLNAGVRGAATITVGTLALLSIRTEKWHKGRIRDELTSACKIYNGDKKELARRKRIMGFETLFIAVGLFY